MHEIDHTYPQAHHGLHYKTPPTVWDDALPIGNGIMGALIWGDGHPLKVSLDRTDLWDLRPVPEYHSAEYSYTVMREWHQAGRVQDLLWVYDKPYERPAPTKIPAGRIEFDLQENVTCTSMSLDLRQALATADFTDDIRVQALMHAEDPVGLVMVHSPTPLTCRLIAPPFGKHSGDEPESSSDLRQLGYPDPVELSGNQWRAFTQQGIEGFSFAVYVAWRHDGPHWWIAWTVASSFEAREPLVLAQSRVEAALATDIEALCVRHYRWWDTYWSHSSISLPNPALEKYWFLAQYLFGAASRRGAPPIALQGPWTADNGQLPPWKGDYHHDLNTQLSYWPCYSGNHLEEGLSYLEWLWATRPECFAWTHRFFGLPGLNVPMTSDLRNNQIGGWRQYTHSATTAAWLAQHFYLHWRYSGDRTFLQQRAYPYLRDAAVFVEAITGERDAHGRRTLPLSSSPEIHDNRPEAWFPTITNYDLALIRWLFTATAELAHELGQAADAASWRRLVYELPDLAYGEDGRLLLAHDYPLPGSHRHFSHLLAIHPLGLLDWEDGIEAQQTIQASLAELERLGSAGWCGYSFAWLANLAARARNGRRAEQALDIFLQAFTLQNGFHCNGDQTGMGYSTITGRDVTLEGTFAAAAGVQEMLLQSQRGLIRVFPALPDSWRDVAFSRFRAEGAFLVSASRRNGVTEVVEIVAERGGWCRIISPFTGEVLALEFEPGECRQLQPNQISTISI